MNGKFWSIERFRQNVRVNAAHAHYWGMILLLFLVMGVFLQHYLGNWSKNGTVLSSRSDVGWRGGSDQCLNTNLEGRPEAKYKLEWESPEVTELKEFERFGEEAFGEVPRKFVPVGISSFLFVLVGAYRTGPSSFGIAGLGSRPLYQLSSPVFECSWGPSPSSASKSNNPEQATMSAGAVIRDTVVNGTATQYTGNDIYFDNLEYISVVVYCKFDSPVGIDGEGGELKMIAKHDESYEYTGLRGAEFVAMVEPPGVYNESVFDAPFQYEYLYCGAPLYGAISPHRAREWIAYQMKLFGESSHFILYDAGGVDDVLWKVLEPWVKLGRVTIMNVKQQARYQTISRNQFILANDCLLRAKSLAKWTFFFDTDEYLHVSHADHLESSFHGVMSEMWQRGRRATRIQLEQRPMSENHCVKNVSDPTLHERQWAMEKLVYRRHVNTSYEGWSHWKDVKSIYQAKYVLHVGVHFGHHFEVPQGMQEWETHTHMNNCQNCTNSVENKLHYYHYHLTTPREPNEKVCKVFVDPSNTYIEVDGAIHEFDNTMSFLADGVREFELLMIGEVKI